MPTPRMTPDQSALFIIDVQENLLSDIHESKQMVQRCSFMTQVANHLELPILITEQVKRVFGPTHSDIASHLPDTTVVHEKSRFSGCIDPIIAELDTLNRPNILLVGMEAHICIMQTTLDLIDRGYNVFLVTDAISNGEPDQLEPAFRRMEQAGAVPTGAVSAAYELMADAKHPAFKTCLNLVKNVRSGS